MARRRRRSGRYRLTPRRAAALKKAQLISARKRRNAKVKSVLRGAAAIGVSAGSTFLSYHTRQYIVNPKLAVRHAKVVGRGSKKVSMSAYRKLSGKKNNSQQLRLF